ncbi:MAG: flagellar assembly protein FliH [Gammaproteobacteria bacterium]|nr:flagellar assembly protein FliH [Gammaproteobacteria bacterium]
MSRVINKNDSLLCSNWQTPIVEELTEGPGEHNIQRSRDPVIERQLALIKKRAQKDGYLAGFNKGVAEGNLSGLQQASQTRDMLVRLLDTLSAPLKQLDEQVEQQFVRLVMIITNQLVRRELKADPGEVISVVREALQALPVASRNVRVLLCPEDIGIVSGVLNVPDSNTAWEIVDDPTLARGDCRIESENSSIDATVERRLMIIIREMLGGERETDEMLGALAGD